jgi:hypothetical protein
VNNASLQNILANNVVELTFVRRHQKLGYNDVRAVLGTTNYKLLNSPDFGFAVLHFQPPKGVGMGYNYKAKNLCVIWDFFRQEYRVFGAEQVSIRKLFDLNDPEQEQSFYEWFKDFILNMTEDEKEDFMGYEGEYYARKQLAAKQMMNLPEKRVIKKPISARINKVYNKVKNLITKYLGRNKS